MSQHWIHPSVENQLKINDRVPMDYTLICNGKMKTFFYVSYHFMRYFSLCCFLIVGYVVYNMNTLERKTDVMHTDQIFLSDEIFKTLMVKGEDRDYAYYLSHALIISALVWCIFTTLYICRAYPLRIYHNAETGNYISIYIGKMFGTTDVVSSSEDNMVKMFKNFSLNNMLYCLNGRPTLLLEECFRTNSDFQKMLNACK